MNEILRFIIDLILLSFILYFLYEWLSTLPKKLKGIIDVRVDLHREYFVLTRTLVEIYEIQVFICKRKFTSKLYHNVIRFKEIDRIFKNQKFMKQYLEEE